MNRFDVIIIGAGPGGLNCAKHLARKALKVLVVEKNTRIGPKVCAGGLLNHTLNYLALPESLIEKKFTAVTFATPKKKRALRLHLKNILCTVNRETLARWQLEQMARHRIEIRTGTRVVGIEKDHIIVNRSEKIYFRCLVGADGSNSITRRYLGLGRTRLGMGLQYLLSSARHRDIEIHFDANLFSTGYAWIFPHKAYVSIGTGGDLNRIRPKQLKKNLDTWLAQKKISPAKGFFQAFPINCDFRGWWFNNIFLIGDAAGLASEFSGEGIYQALVSGEAVAGAILNPAGRPVKLQKVISRHRRHRILSLLLQKSGNQRKRLFDLFIVSLRYRKLSNAGMKFFA